jgi:hypothetical protein
MTLATINIPQCSCRIEDCGFAKSRAKSPSDDGGRVKKLRLIFDIPKDADGTIEKLFPGAVDMINAIALEDGDAVKLTKAKKPPEVNVTINDSKNKTEVFSIVGASVTAPILRVSKKAEKVELVVVVVGTLTKPQLCAVDDYFKADCIGSISTSQVDITEKIEPAKRGKGKGKASKTSVTIDDSDGV